MQFNRRILSGIVITLFLSLALSCVRDKKELEWAELLPVLNQNNLNASDPPERKKEIREIEEVDSKLYGPIRGKTVYLESASPTSDSQGLKPRYWLRIEDYETAEMASKRALEYNTVGTYERIERAYGKENSFMLSKASVRLWALARGKRVYALTTDTSLFTFIETPKSLRKAIMMLPEI